MRYGLDGGEEGVRCGVDCVRGASIVLRGSLGIIGEPSVLDTRESFGLCIV